jgi:ABC-2 type transport system permease protein
VAQVVGNVVYFPMLFLSGATLPQEIMPEGIRQIAQWLPMTHLVDLMQDLWLGDGWSWSAALILAAMLGVGTVVAAVTFRWE